MKRFVLVLMVLALILPVLAQDDMATPTVEVSDQAILDGTVTISAVYSEGPGFIVIHTDNGEGAPGPIIGYRSINSGWSYNVAVSVDAASATPTLFAMLHSDTGEVGVYEFGQVEGADGPVKVDDKVVTPPFNVDVVLVHDQFLSDNTLMADTVIAQADGWLVVHADNDGRPGPVLGAAQVSAGLNEDVAVALDGDITQVLWPMLHVDTGTAGEYEFGQVEGADGPVIHNGKVATFPIWTVPHVRAGNQLLDMNTVTASSVLSEGDGWLVVHADNDGAPGPVLGAAPLAPGLNTNVVVELEGDITNTVWPMLHVDTGTVGEYEFGQVEGADGPVKVNDAVVTFPISVVPSITYEGTLSGTTLTVSEAVIDQHGWLVIHADNGGAPGPVLGYTALPAGVNHNVVVELNADGLTDTVFPMLHYDTGEAGAYEFGQVEGADGPVKVGDAVVTGPMTPEVSE